MRTSDLEWMSPHPHQLERKNTAKTTMPSSKEDSNGQPGREPSGVQPQKTSTPRPKSNPAQTGAPARCGDGSESDRRAEGGKAMRGNNTEAGQTPGSEVVPTSCGRNAASTSSQERGKGKGKGKGKERSKGGRGINKGAAKGKTTRSAGLGRRGRKARPLPPSDLAKRTELLEALVYWTFNDFVVPLVRALRRCVHGSNFFYYFCLAFGVRLLFKICHFPNGMLCFVVDVSLWS